MQDLLAELEQLTEDKTRREAMQLDQSSQQERVEHQLQQAQSRLRGYESQEICFREEVEQAMQRVRQAEQRLRQKEEEVF